MSNTNLKYFCLIFLSVLWLRAAVVDVEKPIATNSITHSEVVISTEYHVFDIVQKHTLSIYQDNFFWLALLASDIFDNSDYQILPWPEQSQLTTFSRIISYQHYITSLSPIFSLN